MGPVSAQARCGVGMGWGFAGAVVSARGVGDGGLAVCCRGRVGCGHGQDAVFSGDVSCGFEVFEDAAEGVVNAPADPPLPGDLRG